MPLSAFPITPGDNHYLLVWIERSNYDTSRYHIQRNESEVKASCTSQMLFFEDDIEKLVAFMRANSFATLVSILNNVPVASHIPLVVTVQNNVVKLSGHLARPNPQGRCLA